MKNRLFIKSALIVSAIFAAFVALGAQYGVCAALGAYVILEGSVRCAAFHGNTLGANVLTNLAADIYRAADVVGREVVGIIPGLTLNTDAGKRVALNDSVRSHFTRTPTVGTITPSMTIPEGTDQTIDTKTLVLDQTASVKIPWTGEDIRHVNNGAGFETIYGDQILQAMRAIVNQIEAYMGVLLKKGSSRAVGTAGTTPFASNHNTIAQVRQILLDNGCPVTDGQITLAINSLAGTNLRNLANLQKANEAGGTQLLRQGTLLDLQGLMIKESAGIASHTAGTGASYLANGAKAINDTALVIDTGSGTILAGDIVTFAADTVNKYVVGIDGTTTLVTINDPGLRVAIADNNAMTLGAAYTANVAFHRTAAELAMRPLAQPSGGDAAVDALTVQDPHSGLVFEIRAYKGYGKAMFDVQCVYGGKVWKPQHVATLLG